LASTTVIVQNFCCLAVLLCVSIWLWLHRSQKYDRSLLLCQSVHVWGWLKAVVLQSVIAVTSILSFSGFM